MAEVKRRFHGAGLREDDVPELKAKRRTRDLENGAHSVADQHSPVQPGHPPRPILNAFFLPRGVLGRLGGVLMARGLPQQREIADMLTTPGNDFCEVGCGPGVLGALLAERHPELRLHLVGPSSVMRSQAARRCRQWQSAGRVDIAAGTADELPLPDGSCDMVVATNSVVMWPDLAAGLGEIKRVLRPGGRLVLSWHSATAPSSTSRRLALSDKVIGTLSDALNGTFRNFERHDLAYSLVWESQRHQ